MTKLVTTQGHRILESEDGGQHVHEMPDVTGLQASLDGKSDVGHSHEGGGGEAFPVGSVFIAVVNTDPSTLLGYGTWSAFGAGKVLVGYDSTDTDFNAAEKTGGAKTVTPGGAVSQPTFTGDAVSLTHSGTAVADHASHTHTYSQVPNHVHVQRAQGGTTGSTTGTHLMTSAATGGSLRSSAQSTLDPTGGVATGTTNGPSATLTHLVTQPNAHSHTPTGTISQPSFTGSASSVVQPYITVYLWKRTA